MNQELMDTCRAEIENLLKKGFPDYSFLKEVLYFDRSRPSTAECSKPLDTSGDSWSGSKAIGAAFHKPCDCFQNIGSRWLG